MKKALLLLLLISATVGADAQWKLAKFKQNLDPSSNDDDEYEKGNWIAYSENRNGTIHLYDNAPEDGITDWGNYPNSIANKYLDFSGYYVGQVRDLVDDFVNVRKGPGTNYPVVGKYHVGEYIFL